MKSQALCIGVGLIVGLFIHKWLFTHEIETKTEIKEVRTTDTVYVTVRDTIRLIKTEIKHEYLRDTILIDFKPQIKSFTASKRFLYGNSTITGEVLGEVIKIDLYNDFKLPTVTNTIERTITNTVTKKPRGLYIGAGVNSQLTPFGKVDYLDNQYIFSYQYSPIAGHAIGVSRKLF